jgi:ABC-type maltose transport system permease subunit
VSGAPIETKVSLPAITVAALSTFWGAIYAVMLAHGLIDPTEEQMRAHAALGAAAVYLIHVGLAYLAPHTRRHDLES